jgi:23S rRNA pseudouridine1911/1915/1917 synthase
MFALRWDMTIFQMNTLFEVIHEDAELLAINKPADLVCHPTKGDVYSSLISRVRLHLGGASEPQMVNRLDRETSGVVLVAKTSEAARDLRRLWEDGRVTKRYLAIVHGRPEPAAGLIDAPLGRDEGSMVAIKDKVRLDGAAARTEFELVRSFQRDGRDFSLLSIRPLNGRKHQIRIHLAHLGHPIVGDKLYGGDEMSYLNFVEGRLTEEQRRTLILPTHGLHAERIDFTWRGTPVCFRADVEPWFARFAGIPS